MSDALKTIKEGVEKGTLDLPSDVRRRLSIQEEEKKSPTHHQAHHEDVGLAEFFISMISNSRREAPKGMSSELESIRRVCSAIFDEVENGDLTESEARAMIEFVASGFVGRRVNEIVEGLFDPHGYNKWFVAASRDSYGD